MPYPQENSDPYCSGFTGFFTGEEITLAIRHAEIPHRVSYKHLPWLLIQGKWLNTTLLVSLLRQMPATHLRVHYQHTTQGKDSTISFIVQVNLPWIELITFFCQYYSFLGMLLSVTRCMIVISCLSWSTVTYNLSFLVSRESIPLVLIRNCSMICSRQVSNALLSTSGRNILCASIQRFRAK